MPDSPEPSLAQLREQVERQELLLRQRTLETAANWYDDYVNPAEPLFDTPDFFFPLAGENLPFNLDNRLKGELLPVYVTEYGLKVLRDYSRWLAAFNVFALNALENRVSYVVGKGFGYRAAPANGTSGDYPGGDHDLCKKAQRVLDRFLERTDWGELEQEVMRRADRDGEAFLRFFHTGHGRCTVRTVEPEHVRSPGDQSAHLSFGVETPEHDVQDTRAFWVVEEPSLSWSPSRVPAGEVVHVRFNVDRTAKRGYPTLVPVRKNLLRADKLLQNMSTLAQVQATFALIRKHKQYSASAVSAWQQGQADLAVNDPLGGSTRYLQRYLPGTILDVPEQTDYEFPAARVPADSLVAVLQAELRAVAARLVLPEYMLTSNAENANYASTLVAEAPAVKHFERLQRQLARAFGDGRYGGPRRCGALWRVLECAARWGDLPREVLGRVALHVEPPSPVARDKDRETSRAAALNRAGVLSKATWAKWEGLDPARERRLIRQEKREDQPQQSLDASTEDVHATLEQCLPHKSGRYKGPKIGYDPDRHNANCRLPGASDDRKDSRKPGQSSQDKVMPPGDPGLKQGTAAFTAGTAGLIAYTGGHEALPDDADGWKKGFLTDDDKELIARHKDEEKAIREEWEKKLAGTLGGLTDRQKREAKALLNEDILPTQISIEILAKYSKSKKILAAEKAIMKEGWRFGEKGILNDFPDNLYPGNFRHGDAGQLFDGIRKIVGTDGTISLLEIQGHGNDQHFDIGSSSRRGPGFDDKSKYATMITNSNGGYIAEQLARFKYDKGAVIIFSGCKVGRGENDSWLQLVADKTGAEVWAPTTGVALWSITGKLQEDPKWKKFRRR
jgi:hypothetical protein